MLDEALGQMDEEGVACAARVVAELGVETVLVVCQANEVMEGLFDCVDTVVKAGDSATIELAAGDGEHRG